jgi:diguanylate cyclase (GGDEF)-like protein
LIERYGDGVIDRLLQQLARVLNDSVNKSDILARYNSDFAIVMPALFTNRALVKADDIRRIVENTSFADTVSGQAFKITVSIGLASFPEHGAEQDALLKHANQALYQARRDGGNRVAAL